MRWSAPATALELMCCSSGPCNLTGTQAAARSSRRRRGEALHHLPVSVQEREGGRAVRGDLQRDSSAALAIHDSHTRRAVLFVADEHASIAGPVGVRYEQSDDVIRGVVHA